MEELLIGVYVKRFKILERNFIPSNPSIEAFLVDKTSGNCIKADSSDLNLFTHSNPFTLGQLRFDSEVTRLKSNWKSLLVFNERFSNLSSDGKVLLFEINNSVCRVDSQVSEKKRIAWAFLMPKALDGSMNTDQYLSLRLFQIGKDCKISHQDCDILHLYADHKHVNFSGTVQITIKGVCPNKIQTPCKKPPETSVQLDEKPKTLKTPVRVQTSKLWPWSRLPNQTCKIPNKVCKEIQLKNCEGITLVKFNKSGNHIAASNPYQIHIFEVISGKEVIVLDVQADFLLDLEWSPDDKYLLSVSLKYKVLVWSLSQKTPVFVLPHPNHVLCGVWFKDNDQIITGGDDGFIRHWRNDGNRFVLVSETLGHKTFVSALAVQDDFLYTGSDDGSVWVWKVLEDRLDFQKKLSFSYSSLSGMVSFIHVLPKGKRIIVSIAAYHCYLIDVVSGICLRSFTPVNSNCRRKFAFSPCGSLMFFLDNEGKLSVWNINTGTLCAHSGVLPLENLGITDGCLDYHPHEHMIGVGSKGQKYPIYLLKYDLETEKKNESRMRNKNDAMFGGA